MQSWSFFFEYDKKIKVGKNGCEYILFRIDAYFSEYLLAVEIDEKGHNRRDLIFEEKRQEALEKKLGCKFIRINTSNAKNGYDLDYEVGNIEAFIDEFKNKKNKRTRRRNKRKRRQIEQKKKELEDKIKELEDKNKKLNNQPNY